MSGEMSEEDIGLIAHRGLYRGGCFGKAYKDYDACCEVLGAMAGGAAATAGATPSAESETAVARRASKAAGSAATSRNAESLTSSAGYTTMLTSKTCAFLKKKGPEEFVRGKRNW